MSDNKKPIKKQLQHEQMLTAFMQQADDLPGDIALELYDLRNALKKNTEAARDVQKDLQKQYPFKFSNELPGYEPGDEIKRVFDGSSADEKATKAAKEERAKLDEEAFNKKWDAAIDKEKDVSWKGSIKKSELKKLKLHGGLFLMLLEVLEEYPTGYKKDK